MDDNDNQPVRIRPSGPSPRVARGSRALRQSMIGLLTMIALWVLFGGSPESPKPTVFVSACFVSLLAGVRMAWLDHDPPKLRLARTSAGTAIALTVVIAVLGEDTPYIDLGFRIREFAVVATITALGAWGLVVRYLWLVARAYESPMLRHLVIAGGGLPVLSFAILAVPSYPTLAVVGLSAVAFPAGMVMAVVVSYREPVEVGFAHAIASGSSDDDMAVG